MRWRRGWYTVHRWVGLVVSVQLLAWSVGGLMFSLLDIDNVHGDWERTEESPPPLNADRLRVSPADAIEAAATRGISKESVCRVQLRERFGRTVYEFFDAKKQPLGAVDATTGEVILTITAEQAESAAVADFAPSAAVVSTTLLEGEPPSEFRGGAMPVYQVILDHPKEPHLYVSPITGKVLTRRNKPWRIFDFFWMLHIMDYADRESFNHWLLTTMSALAILTSASGLALWRYRLATSKRCQEDFPGPSEASQSGQSS